MSAYAHCHRCQSQWGNAEHGLQCPNCQSDFVELISPPNQNIDHVSFSSPGVTIQRTLIHSGGPPRPGQMAHSPVEDTIGSLFQAFGSVLQGANRNLDHNQMHSRGPRASRFHNDRPEFATQNSFPAFYDHPGPFHNHPPPFHSHPPPFHNHPPPFHNHRPPFQNHPPNRERAGWASTAAAGGRNAWTIDDDMFPQDVHQSDRNDHMVGLQAMMTALPGQMEGMSIRGSSNRNPDGEDGGSLQAMMTAMPGQMEGMSTHGSSNRNPNGEYGGSFGDFLAQMNGMSTRGNGGGPFGFPDLLAQMFNPGNTVTVNGDAVYSQEALDRIIGQMMEQNGRSTAPGPAPAVAIAALPKKKVDQTMMGSDGKAECSVCMDNVEIGDEVTMLPCNHWFHEQCINTWLKEHNTCPHCRKGVTAAEGEAGTLRTPDQIPRHNTNTFDRPAPGMGGVTGWFRNLRGGSRG